MSKDVDLGLPAITELAFFVALGLPRVKAAKPDARVVRAATTIQLEAMQPQLVPQVKCLDAMRLNGPATGSLPDCVAPVGRAEFPI